MRVLLVIDHFGSGGAQRQMVELACGLMRRGHHVEMFVFYPQYNFFRARIDEHGIAVHECEKKCKGFSLRVFWRLRALMRGNVDVVLTYLNSANVYAELAKLTSNAGPLIVSERNSHHDDRSWMGGKARRFLHACADCVVANSQSHADWLRRNAWLRDKVARVYNGVEVESFPADPQIPDSPDDLRLLAIGRVAPQKNLLNLVRALELLHARTGYVPLVSWVGRRDTDDMQYGCEVDALLDSVPAVSERWTWLGERNDIPELLRNNHALVHASFYEGLPNAVCEALSAATPVILSSVCDHPLLVAEGERGFLFTPDDPESIAAAIQLLRGLDVAGWRRMAENAREYAEQNLTMDRMVSAYEALFERVVNRETQTL
ncbi:glycosyltransferase [bacterium]|nr:glycosyltransferase [bacterium]